MQAIPMVVSFVVYTVLLAKEYCTVEATHAPMS